MITIELAVQDVDTPMVFTLGYLQPFIRSGFIGLVIQENFDGDHSV